MSLHVQIPLFLNVPEGQLSTHVPWKRALFPEQLVQTLEVSQETQPLFAKLHAI